ncbi:MAG TPA: zinc ribbon domain-containing protein [Longimicrobiaceae bacterium]|nr:zinc ribbon domain-containing protein [Longimicrobiaceae bacterium]
MQKPDALDRLYQRLADAVRREHAGATDRGLTIAEIYQHLVPYRGVRAELGFTELAEYEHTLLRLLAGERDYVQVDLAQVREEFQRELRAANPILGMYRDYAAVGVHLNPATLPAAAAPAARTDVPTPPFPPARGAAEERTLVAPSAPPAASPAPAKAASPVEEAPPARTSDLCRSCGEALPLARESRFCPHCGESQKMAPCRACGTALEPEWKFCIRCGYPRRAAAPPR